MPALGHHVLYEFYEAEDLDDSEVAAAALREAVAAGGAHLVDLKVHEFSPQGLSAIAVIAESHLAVHTWPEHGLATVDIFTCGRVDIDRMLGTLTAAYRPKQTLRRDIERGILPDSVAGEQEEASETTEPYGQHLMIDLYGCETGAIADQRVIEDFVTQLCDDKLGVRRYDDPYIARFGLAEPKTAGYSLVQLIESSSVTGHFSEEWASAYLDVFSCRPFDSEKVATFARECFGASRDKRRLVMRD